MEIMPELELIRDLGIGTSAFILVYILLKHMISRSFIQADQMLELARTTIADNTASLEKLSQCILDHVQQKDSFIEVIKDWRSELKKEFQDIRNESRRLRK